MESGTALVHGSYVSTARNHAFQLGQILQPSFDGSSSVELARILRAASTQDILEASTKVSRLISKYIRATESYPVLQNAVVRNIISQIFWTIKHTFVI